MLAWDSVQTSHGWYLLLNTFFDRRSPRREHDTQPFLREKKQMGFSPFSQGRLGAEGEGVPSIHGGQALA